VNGKGGPGAQASSRGRTGPSTTALGATTKPTARVRMGHVGWRVGGRVENSCSECEEMAHGQGALAREVHPGRRPRFLRTPSARLTNMALTWPPLVNLDRGMNDSETGFDSDRPSESSLGPPHALTWPCPCLEPSRSATRRCCHSPHAAAASGSLAWCRALRCRAFEPAPRTTPSACAHSPATPRL
jgi:hypothetical protein